MEKIYKMEDGESLTIIIDKGKNALKISREGDNLKTTSIESFRKNDNVLIRTLNEKKFQQYTYINAVYDILESLIGNDLEKKKKLNRYVDNLTKDVYGEKYTGKDIIIEDKYHISVATYKYDHPKKINK